MPNDAPLHEYAFDCALSCALRVNAPDEAEARRILKDTLDCATANLGQWPNGDTILAEVSVIFDNNPISAPPDLYEVDGEATEGAGFFPRTATELSTMQATLKAALELLQETLGAWEGEEDSVQREHAKHIRKLQAFVSTHPSTTEQP